MLNNEIVNNENRLKTLGEEKRLIIVPPLDTSVNAVRFIYKPKQ